MSHTPSVEAHRASNPWDVFTTHQEGESVFFRTVSGFEAAHAVATIRQPDAFLMATQRRDSGASIGLGLGLLALLAIAWVVT